ncbi:MAG: aconitase X catalytic domain-containing protein [Chloroflexota bacterium]
MIKLTREEQEMLDGKYGYPVQKSMEILMALGDCYGAERMIPVNSAHSTVQLVAILEAGVQFLEEMAAKGGKFRIYLDTNPISIDPETPHDFGLSEGFIRRQTDATNALIKMGAFLSNTCTPYLIGHMPRFGEHVAWNESSAVNFVNSVFGARTNREGGPSSFAAALTGRVAEYGYHLDHNRYGQLEIRVTVPMNGLEDYGALGYFAGKVAGNQIPVFVGLPQTITLDDFRMIGAPAANIGAVELYHAVGITPEAPTLEAAFGGKKVRDWQTVEFGKKEMEEAKAALSPATTRDIHVVGFGCPHASIQEIAEIARLLDGKKIKPGVALVITTSRMAKAYARGMGLVDIIEGAGGRVMADTCVITKSEELMKDCRPGIIATDSGKLAIELSAHEYARTHFGSAADCVAAAVTGKWRS